MRLCVLSSDATFIGLINKNNQIILIGIDIINNEITQYLPHINHQIIGKISQDIIVSHNKATLFWMLKSILLYFLGGVSLYKVFRTNSAQQWRHFCWCVLIIQPQSGHVNFDIVGEKYNKK